MAFGIKKQSFYGIFIPEGLNSLRGKKRDFWYQMVSEVFLSISLPLTHLCLSFVQNVWMFITAINSST